MARFKEPDRSAPVRWRGSLDGLLPDDHLARFVWNVLCSLDFTGIEVSYPSVQTGRGRPPYHPRLLAALWIHGMLQGIETAAAIAEACLIRDDFKWLAGGLMPCDQTLLNFITRAINVLPVLWTQLLLAMQAAGLIDLSLIAEDGTKVRVNASPRSFRTSDKIDDVIGELSTRLEARLAELADGSTDTAGRKAARQVADLRCRLARAERAKEVVEGRVERRQAGGTRSSVAEDDSEPSIGQPQKLQRFDWHLFRPDPEGDGLLCPGEQKLRYIGQYSYEDTRSPFRLYGRSDCSDCPLKARCTSGRGRRVKVPVATADEATVAPNSGDLNDARPDRSKNLKATDKKESQPTASLTEPESNWMLATSRKRWEPAFNADIAVTKDGIIVSQFLSTENNDYHFFEPALQFVLDTLGKPEAWVGDGHYSTEANIVLASREMVLLYAPRPTTEESDNANDDGETTKTKAPRPRKKRREEMFATSDFTPHPEKEAVVCPAGEELRFVGEYATDNRRGIFRLYRRRDCTGCRLKARCTSARGRNLKVTSRTARTRAPPTSTSHAALDNAEASQIAEALQAHHVRMQDGGKEIAKLRGHTSEPANAHLHQHGLSRFHVRGFARCGAVLTLAAMAHNIRKWGLKAATERVLLAS